MSEIAQINEPSKSVFKHVRDIRKEVCPEVPAQKQLTEEQKKFNENLKLANANFIEKVSEAIMKSLYVTFKADPYATSSIIVNPQKDADLHGLSWMTIVIGSFNKKKKIYSRKTHHSIGILKDPLESIALKLKEYGITKVENISDPSKGFSFVLKVSFDLDE